MEGIDPQVDFIAHGATRQSPSEFETGSCVKSFACAADASPRPGFFPTLDPRLMPSIVVDKEDGAAVGQMVGRAGQICEHLYN
jgi:hypothetical protein